MDSLFRAKMPNGLPCKSMLREVVGVEPPAPDLAVGADAPAVAEREATTITTGHAGLT